MDYWSYVSIGAVCVGLVGYGIMATIYHFRIKPDIERQKAERR